MAHLTVDVVVCGTPHPGVLESWLRQSYAAKRVLLTSPVSADAPDGVHVIDAPAPWNACKARNAAAGRCRGDLIVFAGGFVVPAHIGLLPRLAAEWDTHDMWAMESVLRGVPHGPEAEFIIAVKRWLHTRLRGFLVPMMEAPHGWGYDAVDYRLRAMDCVTMSGGSVGEIPVEAVTFQAEADADKTAPFTERDFSASYRAHESYSAWYRRKVGWEANRGADLF